MLQNIRRTRSGITERREEAHQQNRKLAEAGFTLIELLIVIVILGILAAVVVFSVAGITDRGVASACKADVASVNTAAEAYYAQNGSGAASIAALVSAGFLHAAPSATEYTVEFTGGTATSAGNADGTTCPS